MIDMGRGTYLVQTVEDLPQLAGRFKRLYMDHETRSGDRKRGGDNPWAGDRIAGTAVTVDDDPRCWYVPVRHSDAHWNIPVDAFQRWHNDVVNSAEDWTNQNVKFDAHFSAAEGADFRGTMTDTLTEAKLIDSDRGFGRGGYGLDALSGDWLEEDIESHDARVQAYLGSLSPKSKDYADCPADILGYYSCWDVITARDLNRHCVRKRDEYCREQPSFAMCWEMEHQFTPVLWDVERAGLRVDPTQLRMEQLRIMTELHVLQEHLHREVGFPVEPSNTADCYELIVNRLGLPVLAWTDDKRPEADHNPSFDKDALKSYLNHPDVASSAKLTELFHHLLRYRKRHTHLTFFVQPYLKRQVDGRLHPQYNQLVRTGRLSCKNPNAQQLDKWAKTLILPDECFGSSDGSQIEFRLIMHYSRDQAVLDAYARDPDTDFHQWVAEMCGVTRSPAKTINFMMGYGGGKDKVKKGLASNMELVGALGRKVDEMIEAGRVEPSRRKQVFEALCMARAEDVYQTYHRTLPGIKRVTKTAAMTMKQYKYAFNAMGRRRIMPERAAWRTLNSLTQGLASDLVKAAMIRVSPRYCDVTRRAGITLKANVHDEILGDGPRAAWTDPAFAAWWVRTLEATPVPLRVPIRFGLGASDKNWAEAGSKECKVDVNRAQAA